MIPADAELTPRNEAFPAWDTVPDRLKPFYARQMEVYAGYSENADYNVGRVIDAIEELGELDNTLVIWIWGDNGASMEGTLTGSFNELTMQNGIPLTDEMQLQLAERYGGLDAWGKEIMAPHYGAAWAWAGNTPFQWGKQVASHLGGTRDPMVIHWPAGVADKGAVRSHWTHVIDVAPTILEVAGIPAPGSVDGIEQRPIHGSTFADSLSASERPRAAHTAILREPRQPRDVQGRLVAGDEDRPHPVGPDAGGDQALRPRSLEPGRRPDFELYYLPDDFSQAHDLAAEQPDKVARAPGPLLEGGRAVRRAAVARRSVLVLRPAPAAAGDRQDPSIRGDVQNVMPGMIPRVYNHSYTISADLVVPSGGAEGVIVANCDHLGGFSLWVDKGKLTHTYSFMAVSIFRQQATEALPSGEVNVRMEFKADAAKPATGGQVTLYVNDKAVGEGRMDHTVPMRFSGYAAMDIGRDNGGVVDRSYESRKPFPFNGTIRKVVFDVHPHLEDQEAELHAVASHAAAGHALGE